MQDTSFFFPLVFSNSPSWAHYTEGFFPPFSPTTLSPPRNWENGILVVPFYFRPPGLTSLFFFFLIGGGPLSRGPFFPGAASSLGNYVRFGLSIIGFFFLFPNGFFIRTYAQHSIPCSEESRGRAFCAFRACSRRSLLFLAWDRTVNRRTFFVFWRLFFDKSLPPLFCRTSFC